MASALSIAFEQLKQAIDEVDRQWIRRFPRGRVAYAMRDLSHLLGAVMPTLDELVAVNDDLLDEHRAFEQASKATRLTTHDAYRRAIDLAEALDDALVDGFCDRHPLENAAMAVRTLLDRMTPFVSRADDGLRMVALEGHSLERVVELIRTTVAPLTKRNTR
ncbi:MAG: hypothetical protein AB7P03_02490 [Kofleriaceae bacterium]